MRPLSNEGAKIANEFLTLYRAGYELDAIRLSLNMTHEELREAFIYVAMGLLTFLEQLDDQGEKLLQDMGLSISLDG